MKQWRRILDIIADTPVSVLLCEDVLPCPVEKSEADGTQREEKLRVFSIPIPRRPDLISNPILGSSCDDLKDSVAAFVLPEDLSWPAFQYAENQSVSFNTNIYIKRKDPVNDLRLSYTMEQLDKVFLENGKDHMIFAWFGSSGIGKVRNYTCSYFHISSTYLCDLCIIPPDRCSK